MLLEYPITLSGEYPIHSLLAYAVSSDTHRVHNPLGVTHTIHNDWYVDQWIRSTRLMHPRGASIRDCIAYMIDSGYC